MLQRVVHTTIPWFNPHPFISIPHPQLNLRTHPAHPKRHFLSQINQWENNPLTPLKVVMSPSLLKDEWASTGWGILFIDKWRRENRNAWWEEKDPLYDSSRPREETMLAEHDSDVLTWAQYSIGGIVVDGTRAMMKRGIKPTTLGQKRVEVMGGGNSLPDICWEPRVTLPSHSQTDCRFPALNNPPPLPQPEGPASRWSPENTPYY